MNRTHSYRQRRNSRLRPNQSVIRFPTRLPIRPRYLHRTRLSTQDHLRLLRRNLDPRLPPRPRRRLLRRLVLVALLVLLLLLVPDLPYPL